MIDNFFHSLDWSVLTDVLISVIPALFCITIHELAHGLTAYRLGDGTAKEMGRLTLNPIRHIDIFGLIMLVIFKFGWAKPVPVNMRNFKKPRTGMALTAIAGPLSNILLATVVLFIYGLVYTPLGGGKNRGEDGVILSIIQRIALLSVTLAVFNLLPIPPLDGSKVAFSFLPDRIYWKLMRYERYGIIILILILNTRFFNETFGAVTMDLFDRFFSIAQFAHDLFR